jgi:hypothetical protein
MEDDDVYFGPYDGKNETAFKFQGIEWWRISTDSQLMDEKSRRDYIYALSKFVKKTNKRLEKMKSYYDNFNSNFFKDCETEHDGYHWKMSRCYHTKESPPQLERYLEIIDKIRKDYSVSLDKFPELLEEDPDEEGKTLLEEVTSLRPKIEEFINKTKKILDDTIVCFSVKDELLYDRQRSIKSSLFKLCEEIQRCKCVIGYAEEKINEAKRALEENFESNADSDSEDESDDD